jgi:UL16 binding protein
MVGADPLILQARMTCHCEDDRHISGSWPFGLNGLMSLHCDSENGHWRVDHPGSIWMKEKWENDRSVINFLKKVSMGDCRSWLQDFMVHWEKMLKTLGK